MKFWRFLVGLALLWPATLGAQSVFLAPSGAGAAGLPAGLFSDPRNFGATCGSAAGATTWNQNNGTNDDSPGINAALATGLPVLIPYPGCKLVTQVTAPGPGATLFSFGGSGPYDALGVCDGTGIHPAITHPVLCVPDAATGATNKCIFDSMGYDGVTWNNITVIGTSMFNGVSAFCNSVGIAASRPQAFAFLNDVSISNMAGIGGATDSVCQPTGTLDAPVLQIRINGLNMGHTCFGVYGNHSDAEMTNMYMGNIWNACIGSPTAGGISLTVNNFRCEFTGHFDANPIWKDGVAFYISSPGFVQLNNISFDHVMGACLTFDGNNGSGGSQGAGWTSVSNIRCKDAASGGLVSEGGVITNACNYVFENQVGNVTALGMTSQNFVNLTPYNICFAGTQSNSITFLQSDGSGPNLYGGWRLAFINGTFPSSSRIEAQHYGQTNNDTPSAQIITYPTTCSGAATGTTANISGFLKVC